MIYSKEWAELIKADLSWRAKTWKALSNSQLPVMPSVTDFSVAPQSPPSPVVDPQPPDDKSKKAG
jgi:hypothetical protein